MWKVTGRGMVQVRVDLCLRVCGDADRTLRWAAVHAYSVGWVTCHIQCPAMLLLLRLPSDRPAHQVTSNCVSARVQLK